MAKSQSRTCKGEANIYTTNWMCVFQLHVYAHFMQTFSHHPPPVTLAILCVCVCVLNTSFTKLRVVYNIIIGSVQS